MEKDKNPNKSLRSLNESFSRIVNGEPPKNKEEKLSEQWPFQMPWDKPYSTPADAPQNRRKKHVMYCSLLLTLPHVHHTGILHI